MRIVAPQKVKLEFSGRQALSDVALWRVGSILMSSANRHEKQVTETVEEYAKKFISDWNLDNKADVQRDEPESDRSESNKDDAHVSTGTGFVITANGHMVTNEHVVSGCSLVSVKQGSDRFEGKVIDSDLANDLALINIDSRSSPIHGASAKDTL
jgi:S1-C subfamily serine protease